MPRGEKTFTWKPAAASGEPDSGTFCSCGLGDRNKASRCLEQFFPEHSFSLPTVDRIPYHPVSQDMVEACYGGRDLDW